MVKFKYLQCVLSADLLSCKINQTATFVKSLFLTPEDIEYLQGKNCLLSFEKENNGKYLATFDTNNLLALCS